MQCNCQSGFDYLECCGLYHTKTAFAPTAEALMRSRYCAYTLQLADYIVQTTHPAQRKHHNKSAILAWAKRNKWMGLEMIKATESSVEFKAHYLDETLMAVVHHEKSTFRQYQGKWYYVSGQHF